jgi:SPP1 family predicted phage head-tail adaptor
MSDARGAGALDHRVQLRRAVLSDDGMSQVQTWANHGGPVWASRRDVSDAERWQAGAMQAHVTTRFVIRWSAFAAGITPKDRLVCDGAEYEITGAKVMDRRRLIELTCARRADA